jgi:hypothetical protein
VVSNFHTQELSSFFSKNQRPLISNLYNEHMVGVDAFDQHVFKHNISRKVNKWPIRIIESCITFALANAKAAYCVQNNINCVYYSLKQFYLDILREHYPKVYKISQIKLEFKSLSPNYKTCIWKNCKKKSKIFCNNENCQKLACKDHMIDLCCECYNNNPTDIITSRDCIKRPPRICRIFAFCKVNTRIVCGSKSCARYVCENHRHPICIDCCIMHLSSETINYSEKIKLRKKFA